MIIKYEFNNFFFKFVVDGYEVINVVIFCN